MPTIAPWTVPPDYIAASRAGGALGVQRSQIATDAATAADRLRLGYAQLAVESSNAAARAAADRDQAAAALALRGKEYQDLNTFRDAELVQKNRGLDIDQQRADAYTVESLKKDRLAKASSKLFALSGKTHDEIKKAVAGDPDLQAAAAMLTAPQWSFLLPKDPTVSIPIPTPGDIFNHNPTRVSGPINSVLPIVGTNAPAALLSPYTSTAVTNPAPHVAATTAAPTVPTPSATNATPPAIATPAAEALLAARTNPDVRPRSGDEARGGYKIGTVYSGLRYLGGDPTDEQNWERAR